MSKVAVCLSGHPKHYLSGIGSINNIKDNNPECHIDVFIHSWIFHDFDVLYNNSWTSGKDKSNLLAEHPSEEEVFERLNQYPYIKDCKVESFNDLFPSLCSIKENLNIGREVSTNIGPVSMHYSIYQSNKLKVDFENKTNTKYDLCVRMRFDSNIMDDFKFNSIDPGAINIPSKPNHCGCNDQFAVSNSDLMNQYSSLIINPPSPITYHPETMLLEHLNNLNLTIKRPPIRVAINNNDYEG